ncbi:hypothetical protein [Ramlibacter sp.]|uniref:COG4280 domain-containing protein n=1 Tax=Ramlibacter sp. TaxID=1917967 RepID=UPI00260FB244|nr:hypothetical protein [Ramlibacter sp.]MDB5955857.1 hypothetical protein [Ramlibacter sp.]
MTSWSSAGPTVLASFLASLVEFVEALTIVLAVGLTRGWKSSLLGTAAGVAALVALVAALGPSLQSIPLAQLQLAVGLLLLLFGMRWLQKAVLRSAGVIALRDEALEFSTRTRALQGDPRGGGGIDATGFLTAFKAVLLEGIEVVFVVVALSLKGGMLLPASAGALLALLLVALLGLLLHRPLATVPENTLKFSVGVMLTAFGTYWTGEGLGFAWPGSDAIVLLLIAAFLAMGWLLARACARLPAPPARTPSSSGSPARAPRGLLPTMVGELLGLFVDDLWLAFGIAGWVLLSAALLSLDARVAASAPALFPAGLAGVLAVSAWRRALAAAPLARSTELH